MAEAGSTALFASQFPRNIVNDFVEEWRRLKAARRVRERGLRPMAGLAWYYLGNVVENECPVFRSFPRLTPRIRVPGDGAFHGGPGTGKLFECSGDVGSHI